MVTIPQILNCYSDISQSLLLPLKLCSPFHWSSVPSDPFTTQHVQWLLKAPPVVPVTFITNEPGLCTSLTFDGTEAHTHSQTYMQTITVRWLSAGAVTTEMQHDVYHDQKRMEPFLHFNWAHKKSGSFSLLNFSNVQEFKVFTDFGEHLQMDLRFAAMLFC